MASIGVQALRAQETLSRAFETRDTTDVEAASLEWQKLSQLTDSTHPHREAILATFGVALLLRWECFKDPGDLDIAITVLDRALRLTPPHANRDRYQNLANLGAALLDRGLLRNDSGDMRKSVQFLEDAHAVYMTRGKDLLAVRALGACRVALDMTMD